MGALSRMLWTSSPSKVRYSRVLQLCMVKELENMFLKKSSRGRRRQQHTPLIPALRRQRQMDLCEFKASLVYRARSRTAYNEGEEMVCTDKCTGVQQDGEALGLEWQPHTVKVRVGVKVGVLVGVEGGVMDGVWFWIVSPYSFYASEL
ncbi:hypothetical protein STEG23_022166, partial [Scotinomys teguina]